MKSALVFLAFVALSQAGVPMPRDHGRVVNGKDVELGEIPYQVSLQMRKINMHFCGGSVLNENYVLTAGHCLMDKKASDVQVVAGSVSLDEPKSLHLAVALISHENFDLEVSTVDDIALIKVNVPFRVSKTLQFVPLPEPHQLVPTNTDAVVSGWGRLWQNGKLPRQLQRTDVFIADQRYCNKVYSGLEMGLTVGDSQICANDPNVFTGACHGDSGGPLTVHGKIVGVASFTNGCGSTKYPTVYTRVSEYLDWINENAV